MLGTGNWVLGRMLLTKGTVFNPFRKALSHIQKSRKDDHIPSSHFQAAVSVNELRHRKRACFSI